MRRRLLRLLYVLTASLVVPLTMLALLAFTFTFVAWRLDMPLSPATWPWDFFGLVLPFTWLMGMAQFALDDSMQPSALIPERR